MTLFLKSNLKSELITVTLNDVILMHVTSYSLTLMLRQISFV